MGLIVPPVIALSKSLMFANLNNLIGVVWHNLVQIVDIYRLCNQPFQPKKKIRSVMRSEAFLLSWISASLLFVVSHDTNEFSQK